MKAAVMHRPGDIRVEDVEMPPVKPGHARVRVAACGVCGSDIPRMLSKGAHVMPLVCGYEFAGTIDAVGEGVEGYAPGELDTVPPMIPCLKCDQCVRGFPSRCVDYDYFGRRRDGAYAEFVSVPLTNLVKVPADMAPTAASLVVREEIFGPVVTSSTFRTPDEAIALANDTRYGLAASVWSENLNRALELAAAVKAGVVWINSANQFDAAAGFGGYRESGYGREGGREGMAEYLAAEGEDAPEPSPAATPVAEPLGAPAMLAAVDRTAKLYIGGKQARPDSGYSYAVLDPAGVPLGLAPLGNRKDVRNAVEAARKAAGWSRLSGHARAQVIYYLAENLAARAPVCVDALRAATGASAAQAKAEVDFAVRRLFRYAALADKVDGRVHATLSRHVTLAMNEPWGVLGLACPDQAPLAGLVGLLAPAIALGNRVVAIASQTHALVAAEFYPLLDTSDVPAGVVNLLTGDRAELAGVLAAHDDVDALWYVGDAAGRAAAEAASAGNLKPV